MAKYLIEKVKNGIDRGGMGCGPIPGTVTCEVLFKNEDDSSFYMSLAENEGFPNFYITDKSTFDEQMNGDWSNEFIDFMNAHYVEQIDDYSEVFKKTDDKHYQLYRYLTYMVRCESGAEEVFAAETTGKYLDEIIIPDSDLEKEWKIEMETTKA